ncbi:MAG: hypothetical protein IM638_05395 [Bacteroidetes bacterium]|nr:hypothetical protein [Bacteroidota bacterium]
MKKYITLLFAILTVSLSAQSNSALRFSLYAGAGINSYAKPVYERFGTTPTGSIWDAGLAIHRVMKKENMHVNKLYAGVRYENMNEYRIDHSSPGGTLYNQETDQRALYLRLAFIHEHFLAKRYFLLFRFNSNFLVQQRHTGYSYSNIPSRPEEYTYFMNANDENRKASYFTGGFGLGINLPYGFQLESLIEPGSSPHADYKLFLGGSLNLSWRIGKEQQTTKE